MKFCLQSIVLPPKQSRPARGAWVEIRRAARTCATEWSRPARGAWVEMICGWHSGPASRSRPARGAWVEITWLASRPSTWTRSRPARGAWVEMPTSGASASSSGSRPARGAWVEITLATLFFHRLPRRAPQGARGLKFQHFKHQNDHVTVAPRKGRVG